MVRRLVDLLLIAHTLYSSMVLVQVRQWKRVPVSSVFGHFIPNFWLWTLKCYTTLLLVDAKVVHRAGCITKFSIRIIIDDCVGIMSYSLKSDALLSVALWLYIMECIRWSFAWPWSNVFMRWNYFIVCCCYLHRRLLVECAAVCYRIAERMADYSGRCNVHQHCARKYHIYMNHVAF